MVALLTNVANSILNVCVATGAATRKRSWNACRFEVLAAVGAVRGLGGCRCVHCCVAAGIDPRGRLLESIELDYTARIREARRFTDDMLKRYRHSTSRPRL